MPICPGPICPGHIRGIYASASLKPVEPVEVRRRVGVYPRHLRLGLIEAWSLCGSLLILGGHIRGIYASASLELMAKNGL